MQTLPKLRLTNHQSGSSYQQAVVDLSQRICLIDGKQRWTLQQFIENPSFDHPLKHQKPLRLTHGCFTYTYDTVEESLQSGRLVFATLLKTKQPERCLFRISASPRFQSLEKPAHLFFSLDKNKFANETLQMPQFNLLMTQLYRSPFHFVEDVRIEDTFSAKDLPKIVDADALYQSHCTGLEFITAAADLTRFELRYLNPEMGMGVFCRKALQANEVIGYYAGIKQRRIDDHRYAFAPKEDCLGMYTIAQTQGNITRFINHAPETLEEALHRERFLTANISCGKQLINGHQIFIFRASRFIAEGEQLLVNYGKGYFEKIAPYLFTHKADMYQTPDRPHCPSKDVRVYHLRVMAHCGVKAAQHYLLKRWSLVLFCLVLLYVGLFRF